MKSTFYKPGQPYIAPSHKFKKGDILVVNFDAPKNSRFEIVQVNPKKKLLKVKVLKDHYKKDPYEVGSIIDLGTMIFDSYWFFKHQPKDSTNAKKLARKGK